MNPAEAPQSPEAAGGGVRKHFAPHDRWRYEIANMDEGEAHLIYRQPLTLETLCDFQEWLLLILRKVERITRERVEAAKTPQTADPQDSQKSECPPEFSSAQERNGA